METTDDDRAGPFIEERDESFVVGFRGERREDGYQYFGPYARISADKTRVHIVTDDYEGHAMLNTEALPLLIRALQKLKRKLAA